MGVIPTQQEHDQKIKAQITGTRLPRGRRASEKHITLVSQSALVDCCEAGTPGDRPSLQ